MKRAVGLIAVAGLLSLTACAGQTTAKRAAVPDSVSRTDSTVTPDRVTGSTSSIPTTLPAIDSTTLRTLAAIAQDAALKWSEPNPWDVRAALASQSAAKAIGVDFADGESSPRFVIALEGRFVCKPPSCVMSGGGPNPNPTSSTTVTTQPPVMTMLLTVDPSTLTADPSTAVRYRDVDMSTLGTVYNLEG